MTHGTSMVFDAPAEFVGAVVAPDGAETEGWWFAFRGAQLMVRTVGTGSAEPLRLAEVRAAGIDPGTSLYLGTLGGHHCLCVDVPAEAPALPGCEWLGLRALFGRMDDALFALAGRAVQVVDWDRSHRFCGRCGTPTATRASERSRECPSCRLVAYPRLAPAVMALVRDGPRLLLARSPHFAPGMYSALAGFVEPGESLEQCLAREVREEVGVEIADLRYFGSQSWPFPHSLMVAFHARYAAGTLTPDPSEIEDARWFTADALPQLPSPISVSRRLIESALHEMRHADGTR